ncbi:hypothetical protein EOL70_03410 [Leucothrix sargassi]|nr:hypothetical protein EOL70_03410 [Leucothrix sargassi]
MKLFLIDAIGPFFQDYDRKKINWSKIPFAHLNTEGSARQNQFYRIRQDLNEFACQVSQQGYNAVTLDDVNHLVTHPWYDDALNTRIQAFQEEYRSLFEILRHNGLAVYLTMDMFSSTQSVKDRLKKSPEAINDFVVSLLDRFLEEFPGVAGVIVRIGESDGLDVKDDFLSELHIRTPKMLNQFLHRLLPTFEKHQKQLILRTWTVGAYSVGDLIWHRDTLARAINGINSDAFILSMKYGESDFFRYLPLNKSFFRTDVQKIIELQARREYEGAGEFPAFIGSDYEHYARELRSARNMVGMSVWCQTGGWLPFRRLAYIGQGSIWTEINAAVALRLFRDNCTTEQALQDSYPHLDITALSQLMRLSEEVIHELYYQEAFARQKLFFRRVRIPPLTGVYWNTIFINSSLRKVLRYFVKDHEHCIREGQAALSKIDDMRTQAEVLGLPVDDIDFMKDTLSILALAREYYYQPYDPEICKQIKRAKKRYKKKYPKSLRYRYAIQTNFDAFKLKPSFLHWSMTLLLRRKRGYRLVDQVFTVHLLSLLYRLVKRRRTKLMPKFARKSAMGVDVVLK